MMDRMDVEGPLDCNLWIFIWKYGSLQSGRMTLYRASSEYEG